MKYKHKIGHILIVVCLIIALILFVEPILAGFSNNKQIKYQYTYPNKEEGHIANIALKRIEGLDNYLNNNGRNIKLIELTPTKCIGCWQAKLEYDSDFTEDPKLKNKIIRNKVVMLFENSEITDIEETSGTITVTDINRCSKQDGQIIYQIATNTCPKNTKNLGEIYGLLSPALCCEKVK